jgi:mRNA interferase MazF
VSLQKWDLAWAILDPSVGHEQRGRRPVLVFCNEVIATPIGLMTALPLTTWKKGRRVYPTEVLIPAGTAGLPAASLVLAHQVRTISAQRLSSALGALGDPILREQVSRALRLWLDLERTEDHPPGQRGDKT